MFSTKSHLVITENSNLTSCDKTKQRRNWQDQILSPYELDYSSQESMFKPCTEAITLPQIKTNKKPLNLAESK